MNNSIQQLKEALADKENDDVVHISKAAKNNGEYTTPYPIGYKVLDDAIRGGVRAGDLVICTGLSGTGKTVFNINVSINLSKAGYSVLWISYEMLIDNLYARFKETDSLYKDLKIYIPRDMTTGKLDWVQDKIKEGLEKYDTKFVFIEDISYLVPMTKVRNSDQQHIVLEYIVVELKTLATKLGITIFLVNHVKKVFGRAIEMQDLKGSSGIFQKADFVLTVERHVESTYIGGKKTEIETRDSSIRFLKNRMGEKVTMNFQLKNNKIVPTDLEVPTTKTEPQVEQELVVTNEITNEMIKENKFRKNIFGEHN